MERCSPSHPQSRTSNINWLAFIHPKHVQAKIVSGKKSLKSANKAIEPTEVECRFDEETVDIYEGHPEAKLFENTNICPGDERSVDAYSRDIYKYLRRIEVITINTVLLHTSRTLFASKREEPQHP